MIQRILRGTTYLGLALLGLGVAVVCMVLFFGTWGRGPFITEQVYGVLIIAAYIALVAATHRALVMGVQSFKSLLGALRGLWQATRGKLLAAMLLVGLAVGGQWLYYYHVPKYDADERRGITVEHWRSMSYIEQYRVGQSLYIRYKGGSRGLYSATSYIALINDEIANYPSDVDVESIVFYRLVGV